MRSHQRQRISFRAVNRSGQPGYEPGLQRHHLLPRQLVQSRCFSPLIDSLGRDRDPAGLAAAPRAASRLQRARVRAGRADRSELVCGAAAHA